MIDEKRKRFEQELEICIRSMRYAFPKMSRKEAEKECRKYIKLTLDVYGKKVFQSGSK